jgi:hypothetical protein
LSDPIDPVEDAAADPADPAEDAVVVPIDDPFDLKNLRLSQDFVEHAGVKRLITTIPIDKPKNQDFVRVHPDPQYRAALAIIEFRDERETYLLSPSIARELPGEFAMAMVFTAINRRVLCGFGQLSFRLLMVAFSSGIDQRWKRRSTR